MTDATGRKPRIGLVLSAWAPAMTLLSGAMLGFIEKGVEFEAISTSGTGALVALLALAPNGKSARQALEELPNLYVSDAMYSILPGNFRLFSRNSPFSGVMYEMGKRLPRFPVAPNDPSPLRRLFNDWIDLSWALMTPSLEWSTQGLLSHSRLIADLVDFAKLPETPTRLYLSAFNLNDKTLRIFDKSQIDLDTYWAAASGVLLNPPQRLRGGDLYYTGLSHDPTGLQAVWLREENRRLDMVLALDPLSAAFWREPVGIWDAFQLMQTNPYVALQTLMLALYSRADKAIGEVADSAHRLPPLYRVAVPLGDYPPESLLKWTHSNAVALQEIGYRAATAFAEVLLSGDRAALEQRRFYAAAESPRMNDFMALLDPLFEAARDGRQGTAEAAPTVPPAPRAAPAAAAAGADWWSAPSGLGVLAGGGAPNLHLTAGALCAFYEAKISFDVIGASGAGALPGLLYAAPKVDGTQVQALQESVNLNVSDLIERFLPMNYKVFFKQGPFAEPAWWLGHMLPRFAMRADERFDNELKRLYNDALDLMLAMLTPTTVNIRSTGMCTRVGMLDDVIAWDRLAQYPKQFYVNAFDLTTQRLESFGKEELTPERFWAALAMVWLFEPARVDGKTYTEGASHDPSGLEALGLRERQSPEIARLDKIIALETVGADMWTDPDTLYEALLMTIMEPIVSLAELVLATYGLFEYVVNRQRPGTFPRLYRLPFPVPGWEVPNILRWNYSNALTLWHVGQRSAEGFVSALRGEPAALAAGRTPDIERYRYYPSVRNHPRVRDTLRLFSDLVVTQAAAGVPHR